MIRQTLARAGIQRPAQLRPGTGTFMMALVILVIGFYLITPVVILLTMSFNVAANISPRMRWPRWWARSSTNPPSTLSWATALRSS